MKALQNIAVLVWLQHSSSALPVHLWDHPALGGPSRVQGWAVGCSFSVNFSRTGSLSTCLVLFHIPSPTLSAVQHRSPPPPGQVSQGWVGAGNQEVLWNWALWFHECVCTPLLPTLPPSLPKAHRKSIYPWGMAPKAPHRLHVELLS